MLGRAKAQNTNVRTTMRYSSGRTRTRRIGGEKGSFRAIRYFELTSLWLYANENTVQRSKPLGGHSQDEESVLKLKGDYILQLLSVQHIKRY